MSPTLRFASRASLASVLFLFAGRASAQVDAFWTNTLGGNWADGNNWSTNPDFPNNNGTDYNAFLQNIGPAPYTVTLDQAITVRDMTMQSTRPTLDLTTFAFVTERNWTQAGAALTSGGGAVQVDGTARFSAGAAISSVPVFMAQGLAFQGPGIVAAIDDTCVGHGGGRAATWSGGGMINVGNNAEFMFLPASTFTISGDGSIVWDNLGAQPQFFSQGTVRKTSTGVTLLDGMAFNNTGTLTVEGGTFRMIGTATGGTLTGGTWQAVNSSIIDFFDQDIDVIDADVLLDGAGADLAKSNAAASALANLNTITGSASLELRTGKSLTTSASTNFTMDGALTIGDTASLSVPIGRTLTNLVGGTLTGGEYTIAGTLNLTEDITTIDSSVTLDGAASDIVNQNTAASAVANLETITTSGDLTIAGGRDFTVATGVNFDVQGAGRVTVEAGSEFFVPSGATLNNLVGGTITQGTFDVRDGGTLRVFDGAVGTIDADVSLTGANSNIVDQNDLDLFAGLNLVDTDGTLSLRDGRDLTTSGDLESRGNLNLGSVSAGQLGSTLTVNGNFNQTGGILTLDGGTLAATGDITLGGELRGNGTIGGDTVVNGIIGPGQSPGMLSIMGDLALTLGDPGDEIGLVLEIGGRSPGTGYDQINLTGFLRFVDDTNPMGDPDIVGDLEIQFLPGFNPHVGESFTLMTFAGVTGEGFASTSITPLANGLVANVVWAPDGLHVTVTPSPGALALLGVVGLAARRRR